MFVALKHHPYAIKINKYYFPTLFVTFGDIHRDIIICFVTLPPCATNRTRLASHFLVVYVVYNTMFDRPNKTLNMHNIKFSIKKV